jgi:preprotein translocase subunit SecD
MKIAIAIATTGVLLCGLDSAVHAGPGPLFAMRLVVECERGMQAFDLEIGNTPAEHLCVSPDVIISQSDVVKVMKVEELYSERVAITYGQAAQARVSQVTREFIGHRMAIMINGNVISAPVILSPILGDTIEVTGPADAMDQLLRDLTNGSKPL